MPCAPPGGCAVVACGTIGVTPLSAAENADGEDFAAARLAAYRHSAQHLQDQVVSALGGLNEKVLGEIADFLKTGTKLVQRAYSSDSTPPYIELPAAFVHTCCHSADLPLALRQLQRNMRGGCSPHVAVLNSNCLLYTSPSPRDMRRSRMPSSA